MDWLILVIVIFMAAAIGLACGACLNAGKVTDLERDVLTLKRERIGLFALIEQLKRANDELKALRPKPPVPVWDESAKKWRDANTGRWVKHG